MKKFWLLIILINLIFSGLAVCEDTVSENAGTSGAQYLKMGVGGRAAALGDTYAALSDDAFGIFWNPAGLNRIKTLDAGFMYNAWFSNVSQEVIAFSVPVNFFSKSPVKKPANPDEEDDFDQNTPRIIPKPTGALTCGVILVNMPDIQGSDIYGNNTASFMAYDMVFALSYASKLFSDNFSWGITAKYLKESIENESATGSCFDYGVAYRSNDERFSLGAVLQNVGSDMKFVQEAYTLPRNLKAGMAYWLLHKTLLTALDVNNAIDEKTKYSFGVELNPYKMLYLRTGWKSDNSATFGLGVKYQSAYFDYAYAPFENLGSTHRVSMHIKFNSSVILNLKPKKEEDEENEKPGKKGIPYNLGPIFGKVVDKDNKPVKGVIVKISKEDRERVRLKTKEDGTFKTHKLPGGIYEVKAWGELYEADFKDIKIEDEVGEEVNFKLFPPKNENFIFGMVTDKDGQALKDVVVKVSQKNEEKCRVITDRDGTYKTPSIPYGVYDIKLWIKEGDKSIDEQCKVKRGKPIQLDFTFPTDE